MEKGCARRGDLEGLAPSHSIDLQGRTHLGILAVTQTHLMAHSTADFVLPAASLPTLGI